MNIFKKIQNYISKSNNSEIGLFQSQNLRQDSETWNTTQLLKEAEINLYTNKALNKRAEKVGQIEFTTKNKKGDDLNTPDSQKLLNLLNKPNRYQSKNEFWSLYQKYKDITGSVYIRLIKDNNSIRNVGTITEMELLRSDLVTQKFDKLGVLIGYEYKQPNGSTLKYTPKEIISSHYANPLSPLEGISLIQSGVRSITIDNQLSDFQSNILRNGGKVDGIINFKAERLTKEQVTDAKQAYIAQYSDSKKAGIPLFLGGDADYKRVSLSPEELSYLKSKELTLNDICILTEVPKVMLATVDGVKFDNAAESRRMFLADVIDPLMENLVVNLNESEQFVNEDVVLSYIDPVPENVKLKLEINENGIQNYYMTPNEARENVGLEPIKGGDELLVPFGLTTQSQSDNHDKESKSFKKKEFNHPLRDKKFREAYGKMKVAKEIRNEDIMEKVLKTYFKAQRDRIISQLEPTVTRVFRKKGLENDVFNPDLEIKIATAEFLPLLQKFLLEAGEDTYKLLGDSSFDFTLSSEIVSFLDLKTRVFAEEITKTTFVRLKKEFEVSLSEDENRHQLIKRIEDTYKDGGTVITKNRAATIARTEVGGAMTKGTFEAYKQAQVPIKIWVTVGDARVRDSHANQDGEERAINDPFTNGLQYPRDANGPAGEVINCRCQI